MSGLKNLGATRPSQIKPAAPAPSLLARLHVDIPAELHKQLRMRAVEADKDQREIVIEALTAYLER